MRQPETPVMPFWAALLVAAFSGIVLDSGFPDRDLWPLTFVGIGLVLITLIGRHLGGALVVGFVAGISFYLVHVSWTALYLGPVPWVALSALESLFFAGGAALIALAYRWVPRVWTGRWARIGLVPVVVAALWTARETVAGTWPYGGFAWGRMSLSQSESPFASLAAWVGLSGLSFIMVALVALIVQCIREPMAFSALRASLRLTIPIAAVAAVLAVPAWPTAVTGHTTIAGVQGNGKAGYFDEREPGDILNAQASATMPLIGQGVDLIVWPEGGSDLNPLEYREAARVIDYLSLQTGAPIVFGTITERDGQIFNSSLLWDVGRGALDAYDKRRPIPFGEYVPNRSFWEPLAPDLIGLIQREYTPGTTDPVFTLNGFTAGVSICFDIVDDALLRETVNAGAQVILAQTNNADFGTTDENQQQLAIARLRAIEAGRSIVNISTVGTSQIIGPDGGTITQIPAYEPGRMVADVPLSDGITPAVAVGGPLELFLCLFGLGSLVTAGVLLPRVSRRTRNAVRVAAHGVL
ncbi:apolipoprotein N-acyltransferase [Okibacterium endophyticum]